MEETAFVGNNVWVLEHLQDVHLIECSLALLLGHLLDGDLFDHQQRVVFDLTHKIHLTVGEGRGGEGRRGGGKGEGEDKGTEGKGKAARQIHIYVGTTHAYVCTSTCAHLHTHTHIYTLHYTR